MSDRIYKSSDPWEPGQYIRFEETEKEGRKTRVYAVSPAYRAKVENRVNNPRHVQELMVSVDRQRSHKGKAPAGMTQGEEGMWRYPRTSTADDLEDLAEALTPVEGGGYRSADASEKVDAYAKALRIENERRRIEAEVHRKRDAQIRQIIADRQRAKEQALVLDEEDRWGECAINGQLMDYAESATGDVIALDNRWSSKASHYGGFEVQGPDRVWIKFSSKQLADIFVLFMRGDDKAAAELREKYRNLGEEE